MAPVLQVVDEVPSTQDVVRTWAAQGRPHGEAVFARAQTAGRGRLGRVWAHAPDEAVAMTVLLRPSLPPDRLGWLALAAAVALREVTGPAMRIKWPNDLLAPDGRKVAGVLAEAEVEGGAVRAVMLGIGVNVRAAPPLETATCLAAWGEQRDPWTIARALHPEVLRQVARASTDRAALAADWLAGCAHLDADVVVTTAGGTVRGRVRGLAEDGGLQLDTAEGLRVIHAGDVGLVDRPDD